MVQLWLFTLSIKLSGQSRGFLLLNKYTPVILIAFFFPSSTNVLLLCFRKPIKIKNRNTQRRSSFFQESVSNPSLPRQVGGPSRELSGASLRSWSPLSSPYALPSVNPSVSLGARWLLSTW